MMRCACCHVPQSDKSSDKEMRGQHMKVDSVAVVVEGKLAEGGFAIVYKVVSDDRRQRPMALKRQFINEDDTKHMEACRREYEIVVSHCGHDRKRHLAIIRRTQEHHQLRGGIDPTARAWRQRVPAANGLLPK